MLGWRTVPLDPEGAGISYRARLYAHMSQLFVAALNATGPTVGAGLDRLVYPLRKRAAMSPPTWKRPGTGVYFASLSSRTIT